MNSSKKLSLLMGTLSLLSSMPVGFCDISKDEKTPQQMFREFVERANLDSVPKVPFDLKLDLKTAKEFVKKELDEGGSLQPLRQAFETGVAGQVGYGFLMGFSSGFCLKKVGITSLSRQNRFE